MERLAHEPVTVLDPDDVEVVTTPRHHGPGLLPGRSEFQEQRPWFEDGNDLVDAAFDLSATHLWGGP